MSPIFFVISAVIISVQTAHLPSVFKICHRSEPQFENCIKRNIEDALKTLRTGLPEIGYKPFEPLEIDSLTIGQGSGPVNVKQNFKNVRLHGLTNSKVLTHKIDFENAKMFSQSISPELRLEANYDMKGRVLLLPVYGKGQCNVTLYNTKINHTLTGEMFTRKGKTYVKIVDYSVTLRPDRMTYHFENLFNGDQNLGSAVNNVLNENWDVVFNDVRSGYESSFGAIFKDLSNRVFTKVPLDEIYPL